MSDQYLFAYSTKSLQAYIMKGGKLRDMVGATSLIDKLSDEANLSQWLTEFGLRKNIDFAIVQAAAGGARIRFHNGEAARSVARIWPLWCHAWAPDLEVVQHLAPWADGEYGRVSETVGGALERARNFLPSHLPEAGPFVKRSPRTGEPAVDVDHGAEKEIIDLASWRKRRERQNLKKNELPPVARAFGFTHPDELPNDFEQVAGKEGDYLAVIHADGNLLGEMFLKVGRALATTTVSDDTAIQLFRYLSRDVVDEGTRAAAKRAIEQIRDKIERKVDEQRKRSAEDAEAWPFAPIVLAGDDLTVACRADLGLPFAETFLIAFRNEMKARLGKLHEQGWWNSLPDGVKNSIPVELSAGAGIVYCSNHYPFSLAYELCEALAKQAKDSAKAARESGQETPDSALSFIRITGGSAPTDFAGLKAGILKGDKVHGGTGGEKVDLILTGCPYFIDGGQQPQFNDLKAVYEITRPHPAPPEEGKGHDPGEQRKRGLPGSTLRDLLKLQRTDSSGISEAVARMLEVADENESAQQFTDAWKTLCGSPGGSDWKDLRFFDATRKNASPLLDLITMLAVRDPEDDEKPNSWASVPGEPAATKSES